MAEEEKVEEKTEEKVEERSSYLIPQEKYLETGIHIGTRFKTSDMKKFIFKMRDDGLYILDLRKIDERVREAAKIIGKYKPEEVLVVASRLYSGNAAEKFSKLTGIGILKGRFVPGTMTNVNLPNFKEPKLLVVCDPKGEWEAIREAAMTGVPVVALCDTDNNTTFVDWIVPSNNKGRRSLAVVFYLLSRELMMSQGKIKSYNEFDHRMDYFERFEEESEKKKPVEEAPKEEAAEEKKEEKTEEQKKKEGGEEERAKKAIEKAKDEKAPEKKKEAAKPEEKKTEEKSSE
ncbi:MAG: 30S ribosomal protein S2 [bacterium]|nr:30S ribosomal protein S2 [bacterium]